MMKSGSGEIQSPGLGQVREWDYRILMGCGNETTKEYLKHGPRRNEIYCVNHAFFHEMFHLEERCLGRPSALETYEVEGKLNEETNPAEIFAKKKMGEMLAGRKDLLPIIGI